MSDTSWIKKRLMGSSTMPHGAGQNQNAQSGSPFNVLQTGHVHSADGGCCGGHDHDHSHDHAHSHEHGHDHKDGAGCCDHNHDNEDDVTNPSGGCC